MSFIFNRIKGGFTNIRTRFFGGHVNDDDPDPYHHGIPGIPTDGKVVVLKNSKLRSKVYLVGTSHISKESAETVKKVINHVRPNVVAIEMCMEGAVDLMTSDSSEAEDVTLSDLLYDSTRAPGGLCMKVGVFAANYIYRQLHADGILPGLEFKIAVQESSRVKARCVLIDEDQNVTLEKISKVMSWSLLWTSWLEHRNYLKLKDAEYTRSLVQKSDNLKKHYPEFFKVLVDDRDKFMFKNIRSFEKTVVAVVGIGHMDGIELLWKHAEEGDNKQPSVTSEEQG